MNERDVTNALQATSFAIQGFLFGLVLIFLSLSTLSVFGLVIGFTFLPLAAVFLWPSQASESVSLILVFILGLLYDILSGGPLGIWMLGFLLYYIAFERGFWKRFANLQIIIWFIISITLLGLVVTVFGRISIGQWPNLKSLGFSIVTSSLAFLPIYWTRQFIGQLGNEARLEKSI